mmetsp:Transcript_40219/g.87960  ORF Transcript_40219/g.87960 Transcript_40219/m.87960 type:complete len:254 (+) Transcript_40219:152-913(+)
MKPLNCSCASLIGARMRHRHGCGLYQHLHVRAVDILQKPTYASRFEAAVFRHAHDLHVLGAQLAIAKTQPEWWSRFLAGAHLEDAPQQLARESPRVEVELRHASHPPSRVFQQQNQRDGLGDGIPLQEKLLATQGPSHEELRQRVHPLVCEPVPCEIHHAQAAGGAMVLAPFLAEGLQPLIVKVLLSPAEILRQRRRRSRRWRQPLWGRLDGGLLRFSLGPSPHRLRPRGLLRPPRLCWRDLLRTNLLLQLPL